MGEGVGEPVPVPDDDEGVTRLAFALFTADLPWRGHGSQTLGPLGQRTAVTSRTEVPPYEREYWTTLARAALASVPPAAPGCRTCGDTRVIQTDRPGATSPRPCPACDPDGTRLTAPTAPEEAEETPTVHRMISGSHERAHGAECVCGAAWDRWNDRCSSAAAPAPEAEEETERVEVASIRCGVRMGSAAWVSFEANGERHVYTVDRLGPPLHEYLPKDYTITERPTLDLLDDNDVLTYAHDAYCDAYGVL